ncbi:MAG: Na+/H+ antiporter NhaA [Actinomycetota bacterium]|nr:Na+/H+ antiporter NhaA [Actinomycetota bacterium]
MSDTPNPTRAVRDFFATEVAGGVVLMVAAVVAMVWANSPWRASYGDLWGSARTISVAHWDLTLSLRDCVNEGLMTTFFFLVGLELKREFIEGELRDARRAALPIVAAIGGMAVPALLYALINAGGAGAQGWAIPMATDIAFALGVLALVAPGVPPSLRVFLLALAIVDDIGAIAVIAIFYSGRVEAQWLALTVGALVIVYLLGRSTFRFAPAFIVLGVVAWLALLGAGVHATLAGVAMALLLPKRTNVDLEETLHPWTSWIVVPVFALANAGVTLTGSSLSDSLTSRVTVGVAVGLVVGKVVGITGASWIACRAGLATLPSEATWRDLVGAATVAGIGFTVALFITELAFGSTARATHAKVGIFAASILATALAALLLRVGRRARRGAEVT